MSDVLSVTWRTSAVKSDLNKGSNAGWTTLRKTPRRFPRKAKPNVRRWWARVRNYDARVRAELAAAHAAVDEAVAILQDRRAKPHERIDKAAKDFLTDVDLASESALRCSLAASTPDIGFYGEEGGGAPLDSGKVWVADPLDGTINYATGSPLCGVMLGLLEDGVPTVGVIDLPFLGVRVDSGAVVDVGSFEDGIIGMGDAFHRGGARLDAYLELTMRVHRRALRFRCVGAASVLWTWLVRGQIQGHGACP